MDACFAEDQLPEEWQRFSQVNAEYFTSRGLSAATRGWTCSPAERREILIRIL